MKKFHNLIQVVKAMAKQYQTKRCFHCAFIFHKRKILSIGWNQHKTHPGNLHLPYRAPLVDIHAERHALMRNKRPKYNDCSIVVIRVNNNGDLANSEPCPGCNVLLKGKRFKKIWYSTDNGDFKCL